MSDKKLIDEILDVLEFCEGALVDFCANEEGLDPEAARRVAWMASEVLVKNGRQSNLLEASKQRDS